MSDFKRYFRQLGLSHFGEEGQKRLSEAHIVLVGVGGVGSATLPLLAGAGIGKITIVDPDTVADHNLHRQTLYLESEVGKSKAEIAAERFRRMNSQINIIPVKLRIEDVDTAQNVIAGADFCIDATDSFGARTLISQACKNAGVKEIMSSAQGFISQLILFGEDYYLPSLVADESAFIEAPRGLPIFGPAAHLSGVWGAGMAIRVIAQNARFEIGLFRYFDQERGAYFNANFRR